MYWSFSNWFQLKGKSCKMFYIMSKKSSHLNFDVGVGAAAWQGWPTSGWVDIVLEISWFVFCIQNCDHFHHVLKVTTDFYSPLKFSGRLPYVHCPQLHISLFPQCKPSIPINQLTVIIESLRASVTLMATYLVWLAIKPKATCDFTIYGGITTIARTCLNVTLYTHCLSCLSLHHMQ